MCDVRFAAGDGRAAACALSATIHVGWECFDALRPHWQQALEAMPRPSIFITPEYIEASLQHLSGPGDEAWFVTVHRGFELVGLLPLLRTRTRHLGLPVHTLLHAGALSGDRPGLICTADPAAVWQALIGALCARREDWQLLDLRELDEGSPVLGDALWRPHQPRCGFGLRRSAWTHAAYLPLQGDWAQYLASRSRNTRQAFRRRERLLQDTWPDARIEVVDRPEAIGAAFERYLAIEACSWKAAAQAGLWADERQQRLYRDLLPQLARDGRASVWLLRAGGRDIAALVRLRQGPIVYERHATFDPAHARLSPSTYLCMQAVRASFGSGCRESDALGMPEPVSERPSIAPWYPGQRRTWRLLVTHLPWYLRALSTVQALWRRHREAAALPPAPRPVLGGHAGS